MHRKPHVKEQRIKIAIMPKSLISIKDFTKDEILHVLEVAKEFEAKREQNFLKPTPII